MGEACQVDFYVLGDQTPGAEQMAGRLARMAWERGHHVTVLVGSDASARHLDELMWEGDARFLAHGRAGTPEGEAARVVIAEQLPKHGDVAINLRDDALPEDCPFQRILEFVPTDAAQRAASRAKFKHYKDRGLEPATHTLNR